MESLHVMRPLWSWTYIIGLIAGRTQRRRDAHAVPAPESVRAAVYDGRLWCTAWIRIRCSFYELDVEQARHPIRLATSTWSPLLWLDQLRSGDHLEAIGAMRSRAGSSTQHNTPKPQPAALSEQAPG